MREDGRMILGDIEEQRYGEGGNWNGERGERIIQKTVLRRFSAEGTFWQTSVQMSCM